MHNDPPLVSIIIPTFNRAHLIGETLDSVLAQTYPHWECIIVDDGSTDPTDKVVQDYVDKDARFRYFHRPPEHLPGGNGARNFGFKMSKGEFVNWFDDDDVMLPEFLKNKIEAFSSQIKMVICSCFLTDESLKNEQRINYRIETNLYKDYVLWKLKIFTPSVLFKRNFLNESLFDERLLRGQENEFFSRIFYRLSENKFCIINEPLFLYRFHEVSKTQAEKNYQVHLINSQIKVLLHNIERALKINDTDIINYCCKNLMIFYFKALKFKDTKTAFGLWKKILSKTDFISLTNKLEFMTVGFLFNILKLYSYRLEKRWTNNNF